MKTKRTLSIILVVVMVLSMCSITASAEETKNNYNITNILGDLANQIYEAVTGEKVETKPITEDHICHYEKTEYTSKNAFQHYVQWKCSCGRVLMAYDEAHHIGWDLTCSLCGYGAGNNGGHTHTEDHRTITPIDAHTHRVDVYCACGELIDSFNEPHSFNDKGICSGCGYDKNGGNGGNGGNGKGDNGDREPKSGEFNGNTYTIIYSKIDWKTAKALCEAVGRHLVTITSVEEQEFINSLNSDNDNLWIGGFFNDDWNWVTDEAWEYTNWIKNPVDAKNCSCSAVFPTMWTNLKYNNVVKLDGFIMEGEGYTINK